MRKQFANYKAEEKFRDDLLIAVAAQFPLAVLPKNSDDKRPRGNLLLGDGSEMGLWLRYDSFKNRLEVGGHWPSSRVAGDSQSFTPNDLYNPREASPAITVDADKSPEKIASDIRRRFLPDYARVFARCVERRDAHEAYVKNINATAKKLAFSIGTDAHGSGGNRFLTPHISFYKSVLPLVGDIEVRSEYCAVKLDVPNDKVEKLLEFLKTL